MDLARIRAAQPEVVSEAALQLRRLGDRLSDVERDLQGRVRQPLRQDWQGAAALAADQRIGSAGQRVTAHVEHLLTAERELLRFADGLTAAQDLVTRADRLASRSGLQIRPDGSVDLEGSFFQMSEDERASVTQAAQELSGLLQQAVDTAGQADAAFTQALSALPGLALAQEGGQREGGDGFWDRAAQTAGGWFDMDFDNSIAGEWWEDFNEGDRGLLERIFVDPDGQLDIFGDLNEADEAVVDEVLGGTPDEIFGEEVVDRVHDEGLSSLPDAMWDDFYGGVTDIPGDVSDGIESFMDDPVGSFGRAFGIG